MSTEEIEPEKPGIEEIGEQLMSWSHGLDQDGGIGSMRLAGKYGFLQLHAQDSASKVEKRRGDLYNAFDSALDDDLWLDDENVEDRYGEVTDETIFRYIEEHLDTHSLGENFLAWLASEMDVEYEPW